MESALEPCQCCYRCSEDEPATSMARVAASELEEPCYLWEATSGALQASQRASETGWWQ